LQLIFEHHPCVTLCDNHLFEVQQALISGLCGIDILRRRLAAWTFFSVWTGTEEQSAHADTGDQTYNDSNR
jgi:hypothetical protein